MINGIVLTDPVTGDAIRIGLYRGYLIFQRVSDDEPILNIEVKTGNISAKGTVTGSVSNLIKLPKGYEHEI